MKIKNETQYDTRTLRRIFAACEKQIFRTYLVHGERKDRQVWVKTNRKGRVAGYAWYQSNSIVITLPPPTSTHLGTIKEARSVSARTLAQVYLHEVGHNIGLRHRQMKPCSKIDVSWLPDGVLPLKSKKVEKPKVNILEIRAAHAQKKLDEWIVKLGRAKTYVKKYQCKVKYYQRKTAANN